ncbi:hypothetical protein CYMTET_20626, partial [Cymbomonas tetramitiformis]
MNATRSLLQRKYQATYFFSVLILAELFEKAAGVTWSNSGFDDDRVTTGLTFEYVTSPKPTSWTSGDAGILLVKQGSDEWGGLQSSNGNNYVGLQGRHAYVTQTASDLTIGRSHVVSFKVASRPGYSAQQQITITQDGTTIYDDYPSQFAFEDMSSQFTPTSSSVVFKVENLSPSNVDSTVFIDAFLVYE